MKFAKTICMFLCAVWILSAAGLLASAEESEPTGKIPHTSSGGTAVIDGVRDEIYTEGGHMHSNGTNGNISIDTDKNYFDVWFANDMSYLYMYLKVVQPDYANKLGQPDSLVRLYFDGLNTDTAFLRQTNNSYQTEYMKCPTTYYGQGFVWQSTGWFETYNGHHMDGMCGGENGRASRETVGTVTTSKGVNGDYIHIMDTSDSSYVIEARIPLTNAAYEGLKNNGTYTVGVAFEVRLDKSQEITLHCNYGGYAYSDDTKDVNTDYMAYAWADFTLADDLILTPYQNDDPVQYTVTWDVNGQKTEEKYDMGATPSYKGDLDSFEKNGFRYTFTGWSPELVDVTKDTTYTAQWSREKIEVPTEEPTAAPTEEPTAATTDEAPGDTGTGEGKGCKSSAAVSSLSVFMLLLGGCACLKSSKKD